MSIDSARNKVVAIQKQIAQLQKDKGREAGKVSDLTKKASSAYQATVKATSTSTASSKMREYERHQASIAAVHKKVGDYEDRIAREQQKLVDAQKDLAREEDRELKKRMKEEENRAKDVQQSMRRMSSKLIEHDSLHRDTMSAIER